uniref:Plancitoxin-1 n=1 Tax=Magallana gigas TaxID=29159 RepID=K1QD32_MAGGI
MYKVPKATRPMPKKTTGKEFYYLDANNPTWSFMDNPEKYGMYNDQPPQGSVPLTSSTTNQATGAHMKGAFAFDKDSGFWLILSVPFFPAPQKYNYKYGSSQLIKAQAILCITLDSKYLEEIEKIFDITKPMFFDGNKPFLQELSRVNDTKKSTKIVVDFKSKGGQEFREYAKSASFGADLYDSLVAPDLKDTLLVETWSPNLGSNCSTYKVYDVKKVEFEDGYWFKSTIDHAKWAVTENRDWACIGDINRAKSQFRRGGGTMCLRHAGVAKQFRNLIPEEYGMYNDQPPKSSVSMDIKQEASRGHMKEKIFNLTKPFFYDGSKPLLKKFNWEMNYYSSGPNGPIVTDFITRKGQSFRGYAKSASFGQEGSKHREILVSLPPFGGCKFKRQSICGNLASGFENRMFNVYDVKKVAFEDGYWFNSKIDHSKWAVTENRDWACIGDINRNNPEKYGMYNDQPPSHSVPQTSFTTNQATGAHMKGAYAFDKDSGFWLILSVPFFPAPQKQNYSYGQSQLVKGQTVLCITLDLNFMEEIEKIFDITEPTFYDGNKPFLRNLSSVIHTQIVVDFKSKGGQTFREYAKSASFGADLYDSLVAPDLKDNLLVETWSPNLGSNCSTYKVYEVKKVEFKDKYWFKSTIDHSKWAVTEKKDWACIGDLNRAKSHFRRGGGTMCLRHAGVAKQFRNLIPEEYGMYNDEPPQSPVLVNTESGAHMKEKIFNLTKPIFYDGSKPLLQKFTTKMNHHRNGPNGPIVTEFITSKGQSFRGYAKSASFGKDLYHSLVAKNLKDNLFVETWHPNLTTNCSMYKVYDVKEVSFEDKYWFKSTIDHAKWAVTEKKDWACIGDINRSIEINLYFKIQTYSSEGD